MKSILILLAFALAITNAGADSYAYSSSSSVAVAGDIPSSINPITGIAGIIDPQIPVASASTATETFTTGGATAIAEAVSEAVATGSAGTIVEDSSESSSISINGQTLDNPASAIVDKIKEEIKDLQMSV